MNECIVCHECLLILFIEFLLVGGCT